MRAELGQRCTAFEGGRQIAAGPVEEIAMEVKARLEAGAPVLVFDDRSGDFVELDLRGGKDEILARLGSAVATGSAATGRAIGRESASRGPGRPKLGVVAREVTLLPRHWEWLASQPGGASVALRKLVEAARREGGDADRRRAARDALYRFLSAMAGNEPGFEEAARALFAGDRKGFEAASRSWPRDVRDYARRLAGAIYAPQAEEAASSTGSGRA